MRKGDPLLKRIRVLLVDDHKIVRQGMRHLLELDEGIKVVGEAENGEEALASATATKPDVVLMDVRIPGESGIEVTRHLKSLDPTIEVIILTSYAEEYVSQAIEAGASGYLLKSVDYKELCSAIRAVCRGEVVIDRTLGRDLFHRFASLSRESKRAHLSDRQLEVLQLLAAGLSRREISERLFLSETTVKREFSQLFDKLGVSSGAHAVSEAHRRGLIRLPNDR